MWCWPARCTCRWGRTSTSAATRAGGSSPRRRTRCAWLGTDWIDLYQIHRYDPDTDTDETLGALTDLIRPGRSATPAHSTWPVSAIVEAQWTAADRNRERFRSEQPPYSVLTRAIENDVLPTCARYGMGVLPYSPLAGGWLSGRYGKDGDPAGPTSPARQRLANRFDLSMPENQRKLEAAEQLAALADKAGLTLIELAIAFVLRHPAVTAAIIGPRTMDHLESQLPAAGVAPARRRARPNRHDRPARRDPQPRRQRLGQPHAFARRPPPVIPRPERLVPAMNCHRGDQGVTVLPWMWARPR